MKRMRLFLAAAVALLALAALTGCPQPVDPVEPDNFTVQVLRSAGGVALEGATVQVMNPDGTLVDSGTTNANGEATVRLPGDGDYVVTSVKAGAAMGRYQGALALDGSLDVYSYDLGMTSYAAIAPTLDLVEISSDGSAWTELAAGASLTGAEAALVRATFTSHSSLDATAWSGLGITLSLDGGRTNQTYGDLYGTAWRPVSTTVTSIADVFETVAEWDLTGVEFATGQFNASFIVFDFANNRLEADIPFVGADVIATDPDLSAVAPTLTWVEGRTWGYQNTIFSTDPVPRAAVYHEGIATSSYIRLTIHVDVPGATPGVDPDVPQNIRALEIWRSTAGAEPVFVAELVWPYLNSAASYDFRDADAALEPGVEYSYTVRARNATGASLVSDPVAVTLLPAHHLNLTTPANDAVSTVVSPVLGFATSAPALFATADYYNFTFTVKDVTGPEAYVRSIYYDSSDGLFYDLNDDSPAPEFSIASGVVSLDLAEAGVALSRNATYEWNVSMPSFGPYFESYHETDPSVARSYCANYGEGYDATNGWFTLTIAPDAL